MFEFHISKAARDKFEFDETLFSTSGNVIFANIQGVRQFTERINKKRRDDSKKLPSFSTGDIYALGLIDEALHQVVDIYRQSVSPDTIGKAFSWITKKIGKKNIDKCLEVFTSLFPPIEVYKGNVSVNDYLKLSTGDMPNTHITLQEILLLWLANSNPAFIPFYGIL